MRVNSGAGSGAEPETSRRARLRPSTIARSPSAARASRWYIVGTPNSIVAPSRSAAGGRGSLEPAEVAQLAAAAQRAEEAEHEPVDMEQRQPVREHVLAGPLPGIGEPVEVRRDAAPRQDRALRPAGGAGGVDDQRGVLVAGVDGGQLAAAGVEVDGEAARRVLELGQGVLGRADDRVRAAVGEHVLELARGPAWGSPAPAGCPAQRAATDATHASSVDSAQTATRSTPASSAASAAQTSRSSP